MEAVWDEPTPKINRDSLGDICKTLEKSGQTVFPSDKIIYVRLDGRSFSKVTRHLEKPYSNFFVWSMQDVTRSLMKEFNAQVGYCQSDEISLGFIPTDNPLFGHIFGGKQQKINSVLASHAAWAFRNSHSDTRIVGIDFGKPVTFDCRSYSCTYDEMLLSFLWRHKDAARNSIQAICQHIVKEYNSGSDKFNREQIRSWIEHWNNPWRKFGMNNEGSIPKFAHLNEVPTEGQMALITASGYDWENDSPAFKYGTLFTNTDYLGIQNFCPERIYHMLDKELKNNSKNFNFGVDIQNTPE